jgi:hypothetical protein
MITTTVMISTSVKPLEDVLGILVISNDDKSDPQCEKSNHLLTATRLLGQPNFATKLDFYGGRFLQKLRRYVESLMVGIRWVREGHQRSVHGLNQYLLIFRLWLLR